MQKAGQKHLFVAYFRVSTDKQGLEGLGMEAQRETVLRHARQQDGELLSSFIEVESGKLSTRPQLLKALAECRATGATLIVAKLDRLSRNVAFIAALMESGVDFRACDMPQANKLTLHIMAAVAEHEREMISARTKAALQAAKARGVKLGNPNLQAGNAETARRASRARKSLAQAKAVEVAPYIRAARRAGAATLAQIAEALEARGVRTPRGKSKWTPAQVSRIITRAKIA